MPASDPPSSPERTTSSDSSDLGCESEATARAKAALRRTLRARRRALADSQGPVLAGRMAAHVLALDLWAPGCVVAGSWPVPGELDPRPLMTALHGRGCRLAC